MSRMPSPGDQFGRYTLNRELGAGGMGCVFAATDVQLGREVAVKVIRPDLAGEEEHRARFEREAAILARMDSPHVVQVHDYGELDGTFYLVTQLVNGGDLSRRIRSDGTPPPARALTLLAEVADGLDHAHRAGVTHRDIKPSNVLLRDDGRNVEAVLCDFGIASAPGLELTRTGAVTGTLLYMAPERHRGEAASVRGDIYSTGCLLWFALTGSAPYVGTEFEIALAHMEAPIPQLPGRDEFTRRVNEILRRSMAKEPERRYRSMRAMHADLVAAAELAPEAIALPDQTAVRRPIEVRSRRQVAWTPLLLIGTVAVAALVFAMLAVFGPKRTLLLDPSADEPLSSAPAGTTGGELASVDPGSTYSTAQPPTHAPATSLLPTAPVGPTDSANPTADPTPGATSGPTPTHNPTHSSTSAPSPTGPLYKCWNGATSTTYTGCSSPTGLQGLHWMYPSIVNTANCDPYDDVHSEYSQYARTAIHCEIKGGTGFRFIEFESNTDAYNWAANYFGSDHPSNANWQYGQAWRYDLVNPQNGVKVKRRFHLYQGKPYGVVLWSTDSWAYLDGLMDRVEYRAPDDYRGVRVR
ncbi:MAG TPA: protein kinase [Nocardioides sp.]